jgi:hypothetical protein
MYLPRSRSHLIRFLCVVRNSRVADGQFRIGAEFVDEREAPSTMVIRSAPGQAAAEAAASAATGSEADAAVGQIYDVGVGFICASPLPPGQKLMVRCCPAGGKPVTRMCEVVTCRATDAGGYRVGTRFIEFRGRSLAQKVAGWFGANG